MILPVFHEGELIGCVAAIVHEGENGASEPGGHALRSESPYDDGLSMSPFKVVENNQIRRDLLTFLQNSVREPKLQLPGHEGQALRRAADQGAGAEPSTRSA